MPEAFMKDSSVPARWRVLGIINGFHIAGKSFYGSNTWLMEQLDCSEQTVTNAIAELEKMGEIETVRTRRSRLVKRALKTPETQIDHGLRPQSARVSDPKQLGTISDSNSDKECTTNVVAKATTKEVTFSSEDMRLAELLSSLIQDNYPHWKKPKNLDKWAEDINKIHRIDKIEYKTIEFVINWVQRDNFWAKNVLSGAKLRKQFNRLVVEGTSRYKTEAGKVAF